MISVEAWLPFERLESSCWPRELRSSQLSLSWPQEFQPSMGQAATMKGMYGKADMRLHLDEGLLALTNALAWAERYTRRWNRHCWAAVRSCPKMYSLGPFPFAEAGKEQQVSLEGWQGPRLQDSRPMAHTQLLKIQSVTECVIFWKKNAYLESRDQDCPQIPSLRCPCFLHPQAHLHLHRP